MLRQAAFVVTILFAAQAANAQGVGGDLLGGKLIKPRVGQWAWYDLEDATTKSKYAVRQAIVGKEKVDRKEAFWLEIEIVPELGYKTVIKTLMTAPDYDADSMTRMVFKSGLDPAVEVAPEKPAEKPTPPKRTSMGEESVETGSGSMKAERFQVSVQGAESTVWTSDEVLPTGIVRMESANGVWRLRSHGFGGVNAQSALEEEPPAPKKEPGVRVEVQGGNQ